jgi:hypothetical protein
MVRRWVLLAGYAAVASLWTPFQLSAVKMIGYLYCYSLTFLVFVYALKRNWITPAVLIASVFAAIGLGIFQTCVLGNIYGTTEGRFTTFDDPQNFAAYLISLVVLLLFTRRRSVLQVLAIIAGACGIVLTGSRYVTLGLLVVLLAFPISKLRGTHRARASVLVRRSIVMLAGIAVMLTLVVRYLPDSRINELLGAAFHSQASYEDIGTLAWRALIYEEAFNQLSARSWKDLLFGSGTSSSATVILDAFPEQSADAVDGNRSMHNEFLRTLYEWGITGLLLFLFFLQSTFRLCWESWFKCQSQWGIAYLILFPTILLSLTIENILGNAGHPGGTGYALVLAFSAWRGLSLTSEAPARSGNARPLFPQPSAVP